MKVGDLVKIKHAVDTLGVVTHVSANPTHRVTFRVTVNWVHMDMREETRYSFELEVINAGR